MPLMEAVLPRHLQIIYEINRRFLERRSEPLAGRRRACCGGCRSSRRAERRQVRMAHLAIVGSHSRQRRGRAAHASCSRRTCSPDFHALWPEKFNNKTNGVTPRRWLLRANPGLASADHRGDRRRLGHGPGRVCAALGRPRRGRRRSSRRSSPSSARTRSGWPRRSATPSARLVDPRSLFDVQVKRIHEYKRQLLNVLHIVCAVPGLADGGPPLAAPRTYVFAGKAAPGYLAAKQIIRLHRRRGATRSTATAHRAGAAARGVRARLPRDAGGA